jgi:hypothetical protein
VLISNCASCRECHIGSRAELCGRDAFLGPFSLLQHGRSICVYLTTVVVADLLPCSSPACYILAGTSMVLNLLVYIEGAQFVAADRLGRAGGCAHPHQ